MFPAYQDIELPLLRELIRRGGSSEPSDFDSNGQSVYMALADHFELSQDERNEDIVEGGKPRSKWENMVRWAIRKLKEQGLVESPRHGLWAATDDGHRLANRR
jgi:restriction endonuclease Mrr